MFESAAPSSRVIRRDEIAQAMSAIAAVASSSVRKGRSSKSIGLCRRGGIILEAETRRFHVSGESEFERDAYERLRLLVEQCLGNHCGVVPVPPWAARGVAGLAFREGTARSAPPRSWLILQRVISQLIGLGASEGSVRSWLLSSRSGIHPSAPVVQLPLPDSPGQICLVIFFRRIVIQIPGISRRLLKESLALGD